MPCANGPRVIGEAGHTLVELAAVVAIVAVAAALALPSVAAMGRGQQLEAAALGAAQCLRLAHWRAIVSGRRVQVCVRRSPTGGWRLATERESGGSWVADGEERLIPAGVVVAVAGPTEKVFNPDGTCSVGSLTLRAGASAAYRCTLAPATGRVRLYRGERELGRGD
jgi:Tfp pilus assembly protein FimT